MSGTFEVTNWEWNATFWKFYYVYHSSIWSIMISKFFCEFCRATSRIMEFQCCRAIPPICYSLFTSSRGSAPSRLKPVYRSSNKSQSWFSTSSKVSDKSVYADISCYSAIGGPLIYYSNSLLLSFPLHCGYESYHYLQGILGVCLPWYMLLIFQPLSLWLTFRNTRHHFCWCLMEVMEPWKCLPALDLVRWFYQL